MRKRFLEGGSGEKGSEKGVDFFGRRLNREGHEKGWKAPKGG